MVDAVHALTPEERAARLVGSYPTVEYPFKSVKIAPDMLIAHIASLIRDAVDAATQPAADTTAPARATDGGGTADEQLPGSDRPGGSGLEQHVDGQPSAPREPAAP